jgi:hypothetical protein
MNMAHHTNPPAPPTEPPRPNWNDDFRLQVFQGADGDWYHRIVSVHNGNTVLDEGYRNKGDLVKLLGRAFPEATIHEMPGDPDAALAEGMATIKQMEREAQKSAPTQIIGGPEHPFDLQPFGED